MSDHDYTVAKYDKLRGGLQGVALFTKPSTVTISELLGSLSPASFRQLQGSNEKKELPIVPGVLYFFLSV
jgi:hypothetical protein